MSFIPRRTSNTLNPRGDLRDKAKWVSVNGHLVSRQGFQSIATPVERTLADEINEGTPGLMEATTVSMDTQKQLARTALVQNYLDELKPSTDAQKQTVEGLKAQVKANDANTKEVVKKLNELIVGQATSTNAMQQTLNRNPVMGTPVRPNWDQIAQATANLSTGTLVTRRDAAARSRLADVANDNLGIVLGKAGEIGDAKFVLYEGSGDIHEVLGTSTNRNNVATMSIVNNTRSGRSDIVLKKLTPVAFTGLEGAARTVKIGDVFYKTPHLLWDAVARHTDEYKNSPYTPVAHMQSLVDYDGPPLAYEDGPDYRPYDQSEVPDP